MNIPARLRGAIYGLTAASLWGGMYVVSSEVLKVIPPFMLLSMRLILGGFALAILARLTGDSLLLPRRATRNLFAVGILGSGISLGAQFIGTALSNAANGAVITSASPAFIVLFAYLLLREQLTFTRIAAVILASIGVLIVLDLSTLRLDSALLQGNLALALAAVTWGAYSVLIRLVSANYPTLTITFYAVVGGLAVSIPAAVVEAIGSPVGTLTVPILLGVLYLGFAATAFALFLWNRAFALVEASTASLFFFAQPFVGVLLSVLLQGTQISPALAIGGALIMFGVLLSMRQPDPVRVESEVQV